MTLANPNEMRREMARRRTHKAAILELLQARGPLGATNVELVDPNVGGMRACGARIPELRAEGYDISDAINEGGGLFRYVLRTGPKPGTPGYLASLVPVASITGRAIPARTTTTTDNTPPPGFLF
jgi:hypothetical protein